MGAIEILIATSRWGPVVGWDSLVYLDYGNDPKTAALFSPLFPIVLAVLAKPGAARLAAARYLGAFLFAATVALAMTTTRRWIRQRATSLIAASFVLTSWLLLDQYAKVMSDPLALVLGFTGLFLVARHLEDPAPGRLFLAAVLVGLALATRYACLPFLITGLMGLLWRRNQRRSRVLREVLVFGVVAVLPESAWLVYNLSASGGDINRKVVLHLPPWRTAVVAVQTLSTWFLPPRVPVAVRLSILGLVACGVLWLIRFGRSHPGPAPRSPFAVLLRWLIVIHTAFMLTVMIFLDASISVDLRHWLPVYFACLLLAVFLLDGPLGAPLASRARRGFVLALWGFLSMSAVATGIKCALLARNGAEYSGRQLQNSVLGILREPAYRDRPIYADDPQAVEYLIGRTAQRLPSKFDRLTRKDSAVFVDEMERLRRNVRLHGALVVRLAGAPMPRYPTVEELEDTESLVVIARDDAVTIRGLAR